MALDHEVIETSTARQWVGEDGILRAVMRTGAEEGLNEAKSNVEACARLAAGRRLPLLVDMRQIRFASREAREYHTGQVPARYSRAQALLVSSPVSRVVGNFMLGLHVAKASFPVRLFTSESEAIEWLKTQLP